MPNGTKLWLKSLLIYNPLSKMEEEKQEYQKENKQEEKPKKKLVLDASSIIMIVSLILIFLTTIANNAKLLSAWIAWPLLGIFLACMILAMFIKRK